MNKYFKKRGYLKALLLFTLSIILFGIFKEKHKNYMKESVVETNPAFASNPPVTGSPNVAVASYRASNNETYVLWANGHITNASGVTQTVNYTQVLPAPAPVPGRPRGSSGVAIGITPTSSATYVLFANGEVRDPGSPANAPISSPGPWTKINDNIYPTTLADNVGIGTTNPTVGKLEVQGSLSNPTASAIGTHVPSYGSGGIAAYLGGNRGIALVANYIEDITFGLVDTDGNWSSTFKEYMRIAGSSGNVGIGGFGNVEAKLDVRYGAGDALPRGLVYFSNSGANALTTLTLGDSGYTATRYLLKAVADTDADAGGPYDVFAIRSDGNVGIGRINPEVELHVKANTGNADIAVESSDGYRWTMSAENGTGHWVLNRDIPGTFPAIRVFQNGQVNILGTLTKGGGSFLIDHPLDPKNKILQHSFVESPDMKNIYDGIAILDNNGEATVTLPKYFEALNKDFRYQLTPIGEPAPRLYIKQKIKNNKFIIAGGVASGQEISWQVIGVRQDAFAKKHPIVVEEIKGEGNNYKKGAYIHPDSFR